MSTKRARIEELEKELSILRKKLKEEEQMKALEKVPTNIDFLQKVADWYHKHLQNIIILPVNCSPTYIEFRFSIGELAFCVTETVDFRDLATDKVYPNGTSVFLKRSGFGDMDDVETRFVTNFFTMLMKETIRKLHDSEEYEEVTDKNIDKLLEMIQEFQDK